MAGIKNGICFNDTNAVSPLDCAALQQIGGGTNTSTGTGSVTTNNASPTTLALINVGTNQVVQIFAQVVGAQAGYGAGIGGFLSFAVRRAGANAILIGAGFSVSSEDFSATPLISGGVLGTQARIIVNGQAATTIDWWTFYRVVFI